MEQLIFSISFRVTDLVSFIDWNLFRDVVKRRKVVYVHALYRRHNEGGSCHVTTSLTKYNDWLQDLANSKTYLEELVCTQKFPSIEEVVLFDLASILLYEQF